jgi:hypothetical protein
MNDVLVEDCLSRYGLHRVHVMRMGGQVERERWLEKAPVYSQETLEVVERQERELGIWHLDLVWQAREAVIIDFGDVEGDLTTEAQRAQRGNLGKRKVEAVMWWIGESWLEPGKKASVREAADWAAMEFERVYKRRPGRLLVGAIGTGWGVKAGEALMVEGGGLEPVRLELAEEGWVPKGFVVVV